MANLEDEKILLEKLESEGKLEPGKKYHKPKTKTEEAQNSELAKDNTDTDDEQNENEDGSTAEENANRVEGYSQVLPNSY